MEYDKQLILASNSPRRRWLLELANYRFDIQPADVDESVQPGEAPAAYVARLAEEKAREVSKINNKGCAVVAADTTVADGNQILGKPVNKQEAEAMLRQLRGRVHQVFTAVAVSLPGTDEIVVDVCKTDVPMRAYSDQEMDDYIASGDPFDKAGGYAIQHQGFHPVEGLTGCYANVVGLPLCHLQRILAKAGIQSEVSHAQVCQKAFGYECPSFPEVLRGCD